MSSKPATPSSQRFTRDGDAHLEEHLALVCRRIGEAVLDLLPKRRLEALVLGGGYGRGEGGVLKTPSGDQPYNDLEFYLFTKGSRLLNDRSYREQLSKLGEELAPQAGFHVEFKVDSLSRLRTSPVSMFSYDLVSAYRVILGKQSIFAGCERHLDAAQIPLAEATRLLFNRCTGLLLARELLRNSPLTAEESDFIGRNIAKAQLAVGDALLVCAHQYHWSCLERAARLRRLDFECCRPLGLTEVDVNEIQLDHEAGAGFKLHPERCRQPRPALRARHTRISILAQKVWFGIEKLRLGHDFSSPFEYALAPVNKCAGTNPFRNLLLNLNTFGVSGLFDLQCWRYPRERLLNSLPLLLWDPELEKEPRLLSHLQRTLHAQGHDWSQLLSAYKQIWPSYG